MDKIPFSVYDFFAYLSSGTVVVATADYIWNWGILDRKEVGPVLGVALVVVAYVTGQIVAHFSSALLEHTIVSRILRRPSIILLGGPPRFVLLKWIFPNYFRTLPQHIQLRVREQMMQRDCSAAGEGLFLHAYSLVTKNDRLQSRLDTFRDQYGFARNMAFAFFVAAVALAAAHRFSGRPTSLRLALLAGLAAIALFYRYLKFFQQFSYELFLRYSEL